MLASVSAAALTAAVICLICDYFTGGGLGWSWIVIGSLAAGWLVLLPWLTGGVHILRRTLMMASVVPIPLLALLALVLGRLVIFTLGFCVSAISILAVWVIYWIFRKNPKRLWRGTGLALLVVIPVAVVINHLAAWFITGQPLSLASDALNAGVTLLLALMCFGADYMTQHRPGGE